jgi:hypothetical protein
MQNIPVGTMLAHIEQATKVMAAAHKGQHSAMDEELTLIADLFRENPEAFWKGNKRAKGYWTVKKLIAALEERTLVPKSDPNVPSHIHRVMKAVALVELVASPLGALLDKQEALRRVLAAMREDPTGLVLPPQPNAPPSPDEITANAKMLSAQNDAKKNEIAAQELQMKPALENVKTAGSIKEKTIDLAKTLITHGGEREDAAHGRQMDLAEHTRNINKDAIDATKVTTDALKTKHEIGMASEKHGLDVAKTHLDAAHKTQQLGLAAKQHDLADRQASHDMSLGEQDLGLRQQKVGIDGEKLNIAQQQADTKTHTALNPPKPAAGAKPKKKK